MKDKKRTRHSMTTSSSSSCWDSRGVRLLYSIFISNQRAGLFVCKNIPLPFLWWRPEWCPQCLEWQASSPPFLWRTGGFLSLHWWCPYLRIDKKTEQWEDDVSQDAQMGFSVWRRTDGTRDGRHTQIQHMKLLHQLGLWHGKLCRHNRCLSSPHVPCRTFIRVLRTKSFPEIIGLNEGTKQEVLF